MCGEKHEAVAESSEMVAIAIAGDRAVTTRYAGLWVHVATVKCALLACSWAVLDSK